MSERFGFSMVQVIIAAGIVGGLGFTVAQLAKNSNEIAAKARDSATLAALRAQIVPITQDIPSWLTLLRTKDPAKSWAANCLRDPNPVCPATEVVNDPAIPPGQISRAPLVNALGAPMSGGATPLRFDNTGSPCGAGGACRFEATGYIVRQAGEVIQIALRIQRIAGPGEMPLQSTDVVDIGTQWKDALPECKPGFLAKDATGKTICYRTALCAGSEIFGGWKADGSMNCVVPSPPPIAGKDCGTAPLKLVTGFNNDYSLKCQ